MDRLLVGDTDTEGKPDPDAWERFGYDIDCRITTSDSTDVCSAAPDGTVWSDAPGGIDNNFGRTILDLLGDTFEADPSISAGEWTIVVRFPAFEYAPRLSGVQVEVYDGRDLGSPPEFDGSDVWPVADKRVLVDGYVVDGVWVSGAPLSLRLRLRFQGVPFYLTVHQAILTVAFSPDLTVGTGGQLAGIIDSAELNAELHRVGVTVFPDLCSNPSMPTDMRQAADIMVDGSQDSAMTCDGISVGFGFTLSRAMIGEEVDLEEIPPDPCPLPGQ